MKKNRRDETSEVGREPLLTPFGLSTPQAMGIPNLITHLRPYAELDNLRGDVIIDGPALAYHVYFLCLSLRSGAKNPFEASPTYQELGEAVILWLTCLESQDITVYACSFLASSKLTVKQKENIFRWFPSSLEEGYQNLQTPGVHQAIKYI